MGFSRKLASIKENEPISENKEEVSAKYCP